MIWIRESKEGMPVKWYSEDVINKIKEICRKRPYHTIEKVIKTIEEVENDC